MIVCWLKPAEVGEDLCRRTMFSESWRLEADVRTDIVRRCEPNLNFPLFCLKQKFKIICKTKSRIPFWGEDTNLTENFVHLSLSKSVCLLSGRVSQCELSVCQLVRLLVKLSAPVRLSIRRPSFSVIAVVLARSVGPSVCPVIEETRFSVNGLSRLLEAWKLVQLNYHES